MHLYDPLHQQGQLWILRRPRLSPATPSISLSHLPRPWIPLASRAVPVVTSTIVILQVSCVHMSAPPVRRHFTPPPHSSLFDRKEGYTPLNESALNHRSAECETSCSSSQKHAPKLSHPQFPVPPKNPKPPFAIPSSSASNLQTHKPTSIFYAHAKSTKPTRAKRHPYNPYVCYSFIH